MSQHHFDESKTDPVTALIATTAIPTPWIVMHLSEIAQIVTIMYSCAGFVWLIMQMYARK